VPQVTIGIPSYNEEKNIANLLHALERQHLQGQIRQVIISDDSSDRTAELVERFASHSSLPILLLHRDKRRGASAAWNEIFSRATGDTLVLYDADIIPHPSCTDRLASRIRGRVGICASNPLPFDAAGIPGRASKFISDWLGSVRLATVSQYTVMGRALSIKTSAAKKIRIPEETIAIDLYLQYKVMDMGLDVEYEKEAIVYFRPPGNMPDLASQVARAANGHRQLRSHASKSKIGLPLRTAAAKALRGALKDPLGAASAVLGFAVIPYYRSRITEGVSTSKWHTAASSKALDYQKLRSNF
jgi:cellulose synthase/poly-beta-1,6-N-acetylglucosamine synthase-like glycosyltransferase